MCRRASRPMQTHEQRAGLGHTLKWSTCKAQTSPLCTQLIQEVVGYGLEVREGMVWRWGEEKIYSGIPAQALLGKMSCWNDISSKRSKDELEPLGACHEGQGEREHSHHSRQECHGKKKKKNSLLRLVMGNGIASTSKWW